MWIWALIARGVIHFSHTMIVRYTLITPKIFEPQKYLIPLWFPEYLTFLMVCHWWTIFLDLSPNSPLQKFGYFAENGWKTPKFWCFWKNFGLNLKIIPKFLQNTFHNLPISIILSFWTQFYPKNLFLCENFPQILLAKKSMFFLWTLVEDTLFSKILKYDTPS